MPTTTCAICKGPLTDAAKDVPGVGTVCDKLDCQAKAFTVELDLEDAKPKRGARKGGRS